MCDMTHLSYHVWLDSFHPSCHNLYEMSQATWMSHVKHISYKLYACHAYLIQIVCVSRISHTNCMRFTHMSYKLYACHAYLIQIVCVSRISHTNCMRVTHISYKLWHDGLDEACHAWITCDMTHCIQTATWLIHMHNTTVAHVRDMTHLIHVCDMTHTYHQQR